MKRRDRFVALALGALLFALPLAAGGRACSDAYFEGGYWIQLWDFLLGVAVSIALLASGLSRRMGDLTERHTRFHGVDLRSHDTGAAAAVRVDPASPLRVLGGRDTVAALAPRAGTRLRVEVCDADAEDEGMLLAAGTHAIIRIAPELLHVIVGAQAEKLAAAIGAPRL